MYLSRLEPFIIWFTKETGFVPELRIAPNKELVILPLCRSLHTLHALCPLVFSSMYELRLSLIDIVMGTMYKKVIESSFSVLLSHYLTLYLHVYKIFLTVLISQDQSFHRLFPRILCWLYLNFRFKLWAFIRNIPQVTHAYQKNSFIKFMLCFQRNFSLIFF